MFSSDLANKLQQYLEESITLAQMNEWLAGRLPFYLQNPSTEDAKLVSVFELGLAELDDDLSTEEDLRQELSQFMREHVSVQTWYDPQAIMREINNTGSSNETVVSPRHHSIRTLTTEWAGEWDLQKVGV